MQTAVNPYQKNSLVQNLTSKNSAKKLRINYIYQFGGKEGDSELKGEGNSYDFGARMYDPRLGRWLSVDPLAVKYPSLNPYNFVANSPILFVDPDGEKIYIYYDSGEKDADGNPVMKAYEYGSGLKLPRDKFVRQAVRTLRKIERRGLDPNGIIKSLKTSEVNNVAIVEKKDWKNSAFAVIVGEATFIPVEGGEKLSTGPDGPDMISWHPDAGYISTDGLSRQSPAATLLHELGHSYYDFTDPYGKIAEREALNDIEDETLREQAIFEFNQKKEAEVGDFDTYSDKWIIENVEPHMKEGIRTSHREGFFLKTKGSTFSTRGNTYGRWGKEGKVKDLKKGNNVIKKEEN